MYLLCSETKGDDQLRDYRAADLCLYFVYTYTKSRFSNKMAHLEVVRILITTCNIIFEDWKFRQKSYFVELSTMSMDKIKSVMLRRRCWLDCIFI